MAVRNYNMPDTDMFSGSRTAHQLFLDNKAAFEAEDIDFADPYAAGWLAAIEASESVETAETRDDAGRQETAEVNAEMALARKKHTEMKYYINKAFKTKPAILDKFGFDDYEQAGASQKKMSVYLQNLFNQSDSAAFKPALLAVNCTQLKIDSILTVKNSLNTEDTEQNVFIKNESVATKARITQYNDTFAFWQKVNAASKVIYYDQPEMLNLFLFPRNTEPSSTFNVLGKATTGAAATVVVGATVEIVSLGLSTTTDNNGEYGLAAVPPGTYDLKFSKPGFVDLIVPFTIGAGVAMTVNALMVAV